MPDLVKEDMDYIEELVKDARESLLRLKSALDDLDILVADHRIDNLRIERGSLA